MHLNSALPSAAPPVAKATNGRSGVETDIGHPTQFPFFYLSSFTAENVAFRPEIRCITPNFKQVGCTGTRVFHNPLPARPSSHPALVNVAFPPEIPISLRRCDSRNSRNSVQNVAIPPETLPARRACSTIRFPHARCPNQPLQNVTFLPEIQRYPGDTPETEFPKLRAKRCISSRNPSRWPDLPRVFHGRELRKSHSIHLSSI